MPEKKAPQADPMDPPGSSPGSRPAIKKPLRDRIDSLFADLRDEVGETTEQVENEPPVVIPVVGEPIAERPRRSTQPLPELSNGSKSKRSTSPLPALQPKPSGRRSTKPLPPLQPKEPVAQPEPPLILPGDFAGIVIEDNRLRTTEAPVTPLGIESLHTRKPIILDSLEGAHLQTQGNHDVNALMAVPFQIRADNLGLLEVIDDTPNRVWNEDERRLVEQVTDQLALALENARLFQETQDALAEAESRRQIADTLREIASVIGGSLELEDVVEHLLDQLPNLIPFNSASIQLISEGHRHIIGGRGLDINRFQFDAAGNPLTVENDPLIYEVYRTQKPLVISNTQQDSRWIHSLESSHIRSWLAAPLIAGSEVIGFLVVDNAYSGAYNEETANLAKAFAAQAAVAIRNARLFQQVQDTLSETDALYQASAELNSVQSFNDILNVLRRSTVLGHVSLVYASLNLFDRNWSEKDQPVTNIVIARYQREQESVKTLLLDDRASPIDWRKVGQYLKPDRAVVIENAQTSTIMDEAARQKYITQLEAKSLLFLPLNAGGQWIGYLSAAYSNPLSFSTKVIRPLQALASQAAVAVQNLRLFEETRRRATQLETAAEIARDTSSTLALDNLLGRAVNLIQDRYGYYHASIFLIDETGRSAVVRESTGIAGQELKSRGHSLLVGSPSVIGQATKNGETVVINDVSHSPIHWPNPLLPETCSEVAIPLKIGSRIIGALDVQSNKYDAFSSDDLAVLRVLADQIAVAVDNAQSYELAQQAISETAQRVQELSTVYEVSSAVANAAMQTEEISITIVARFANLLPVDQATLFLLQTVDQEPDPRRPADAPKLSAIVGPAMLRVLARVTTAGKEPQKNQKDSILPLEDFPFIESVIQSSRPVVLQADPNLPNETSGQHLFADPQLYMQKSGLKSLVLIPLSIKGQAIGVVELQARSVSINPTQAQLNLIMTIANAAAVALENANLYEQQIRTAEQLREVDKLKSQFLANMSHELRTPLNSIIGFSRVILKGIDGPVSELQQQDLTAIHNAGTHLLQLINDVLDISKIEAGKMELAFNDGVNIADLVNSAMSTAIGLTKDKPIRLERKIEENLPPVRADATRVRQVLINFLSNAAKFTDQGLITVAVNRSISPEGHHELRVSVTDTGPGISPQDQARLFQPFTQVDSSPTRKVGGTGLGLSISRLLIELHNGRIGVDSELGRGATFYFTLPISEEKGQTGALVLPKTTPFAQRHSKEAHKILVIDDDQQVINLYRRYLKDLGYEVEGLSNPLQALTAAKNLRPYAITLDIMMPHKDGWQVLEELKSDPETKNIPIIICSIVTEQDKAFSLGAVDYLAKPILENDLAGALDRLNKDGSIHDVLVVDDDAGMLSLVKRSLEQHKGYKVRIAQGGIEGLVAIQSKPPEAVILDLFMPELDGFALLENIRQEPATMKIPVIILTTGDLTEEQKQRVYEFTQHMLLKGNYNEENLLKSIQDVLERFESTDGENQ